jgi:hypothetical protein
MDYWKESSMRLAVMQPYLFPYIGYFQLMKAVDIFVAYDDVNFIKGGWINRNYILNRGEKHLFSLHLEGASSFKLINQISVGNNRAKLLKTIEQCYRKAPFFQECFDVIRDIINFNDRNLANYVIHGLQSMSDYLGIKAKILASSAIEKDPNLEGKDKVLNICTQLKANVYINAVGGQALYSKDDFRKNSIDLFFIRSRDITYRQFNNEFVPGLSIIDVIMFNSMQITAEFLNQYDLV